MATSGGGNDYDFIFKLVLIGDCSVGKSNLLLRFTRNEFRLATQTTIGVEFAYRQIIIDGKKIKTQVWDTAGQERFKTVIPQLYRGSEGVLAVFDLTKPETFNNIKRWIEEVHRHTSPDLPIILIGNKSDLTNQRKVLREQATHLAQELNVSYMETSALNATNVEQAFTLLITTIYQKKRLHAFENSPAPIYNHGSGRTIPVSSEATVQISTVPKSFRLQDNQASTVQRKDGCCKTS